MGKWLPPGRGGYTGAMPKVSVVDQLSEIEAERNHWEAEHAALFRVVAGDDAAVRIAKAFGGYDDLEWARLDGYEREWITARGQRVVDMFRAATF